MEELNLSSMVMCLRTNLGDKHRKRYYLVNHIKNFPKIPVITILYWDDSMMAFGNFLDKFMGTFGRWLCMLCTSWGKSFLLGWTPNYNFNKASVEWFVEKNTRWLLLWNRSGFRWILVCKYLNICDKTLLPFVSFLVYVVLSE